MDLPTKVVEQFIFDAGFLISFPFPPDCIDDRDAVSCATALHCLFHVARMAFRICGHCGPHRGRRRASFLVEVVSGYIRNVTFCNIGLLFTPPGYVTVKAQVLY